MAPTNTQVLPKTKTQALPRKKGSKVKEGMTGTGGGAVTPRTAKIKITTPAIEMEGMVITRGRTTRTKMPMDHEEKEDGRKEEEEEEEEEEEVEEEELRNGMGGRGGRG